MFEQEIETIINTIQEHTIGSRKSVAIKDILAADIPYSIKTFFRADVEAMLLSELTHHRKESRFTFDHPEVQNLQLQMNSILILYYTFQRDEYLQRLNDTVHLMVNYLIRPQWTLTGVLFEHDQTISAPTLMKMLRYFGPYEYLKEIIIPYLNEKHIGQVTKEDFATLIWKADSGFIRRKTGDELSGIVSPLYEFFDYPNKTGSRALPIKSIIKHFEDKGLTSALSQLEGEVALGRQTLTRGELSELLESARRTYGAFETKRMATDQEEYPARETMEQEPLEPTNGDTQQALATSVEIVITEDDARKFIRKIFQHDDPAFRLALQTISTIPSWKQASKFIDEIFIQHNVDPYSSDAERFIEVIFRQYHPKQ